MKIYPHPTETKRYKKAERNPCTWPAPVAVLAVISALVGISPARSTDCSGTVRSISAAQSALFLPAGGAALYGKMNINIDGSRRAYHQDNYAGGALLHLCVGGDVHRPDGTSYVGSASNAVCAQFLKDYARIRSAGWTNPQVGVIRWYGVHGTGRVTIGGRTVEGVVPSLQPDGSGYYVSPTSLIDPQCPASDQRRYVEPLTVPAAVIRRNSTALTNAQVVPGSLGVAIHKTRKIAVPFIVGDTGPRVGEGTPALARLAAGLPIDETIQKKDRYAGQVDGNNILWVFFGGSRLEAPYTAERVRAKAQEAFAAWGGDQRLKSCLANPAVP
jgi:hypothetical protein